MKLKSIPRILPLLLGIFLMAYAVVMSTRPIAIFSDFKAFEARVVADEKAAAVLHYGGENPSEDFDTLVGKVLSMHFAWRPVGIAGLLIVVLQVLQIHTDRKESQ